MAITPPQGAKASGQEVTTMHTFGNPSEVFYMTGGQTYKHLATYEGVIAWRKQKIQKRQHRKQVAQS